MEDQFNAETEENIRYIASKGKPGLSFVYGCIWAVLAAVHIWNSTDKTKAILFQMAFFGSVMVWILVGYAKGCYFHMERLIIHLQETNKRLKAIQGNLNDPSRGNSA